jgi:hypothetical protein
MSIKCSKSKPLGIITIFLFNTRPKDDETRNDDQTKVHRSHDQDTQTANSAESESTILQNLSVHLNKIN